LAKFSNAGPSDALRRFTYSEYVKTPNIRGWGGGPKNNQPAVSGGHRSPPDGQQVVINRGGQWHEARVSQVVGNAPAHGHLASRGKTRASLQ
jgi:hypothetical protein